MDILHPDGQCDCAGEERRSRCYERMTVTPLRSALTAAQARIEELEQWLIDALTGSVWFDGLSDEVVRSTDEGVYRVEVEGFISDAGLLAAVEKAMGES